MANVIPPEPYLLPLSSLTLVEGLHFYLHFYIHSHLFGTTDR